MSAINRKRIDRYVATIFSVGVVLFCSADAVAQRGPVFQALGTVPNPTPSTFAFTTNISANGLIVVGLVDSLTEPQGEPFRWTEETGMVGLGLPELATYGEAWATSADGSVVVGQVKMNTRMRRAFRWTLSEGMVFLGNLPGGGDDSSALGVSADGSVIVGWSESVFGAEAFRWTEAGGMVGLGDLPGGAFNSIALDVSADGSVVVGAGDRSLSSGEPFRWTEAGGMIGLGEMLGGSSTAEAVAVSADGSVVVGYAFNSDDKLEAFRWSAAEGMIGLGDVPGGQFSSMARDVSADGNVIVGEVGSLQTFIWDPVNGMRDLEVVLRDEIGLDLTDWWHLEFAMGVSDDGRVITGSGSGPNMGLEAWRAILNECGRDADCSDGLFCTGAETCVDNVCIPGSPPCALDDPCIEGSQLCTSDIPTLSQWGLIAMTLLLLTAATCILKQRMQLVR